MPRTDAPETTHPCPISPTFAALRQGKLIKSVKPGDVVRIPSNGSLAVEVDAQNLDLSSISTPRVSEGWKHDMDAFERSFQQLNLDQDLGFRYNPKLLYNLYLVQRAILQNLGTPSPHPESKSTLVNGTEHVIPLSQTGRLAVFSGYAMAAAFMLSELGEDANLVAGSLIKTPDKNAVRVPHQFVLLPDRGLIFDPLQARRERDVPVVMVPTQPYGLEALKSGYDISAKRIGVTDYFRHYGLTPTYGFGARLIG